MTSCLFVKSRKRLVAATDGKLSRDDNTPTFNATRKLFKFPIGYRIPEFSKGVFHGFKEYISEPWYLAYAGTHTVTTEIIDLFRQAIGDLYLTRDEQGRHAVLAHSTPTSGRFSDDYNFDRDEYPRIHARDVLQELIWAFETRGTEHFVNRETVPDSQFILFGNEEASRDYKAFVVSADKNLCNQSGRVRVKTDSIINGQLTSIGSTKIRDAVLGDQDLVDGLNGWHIDEDPYENSIGMHVQFEGRLPPPIAHQSSAWSTSKVGQRFLQILRVGLDASVGGTMILAEGDWTPRKTSGADAA